MRATTVALTLFAAGLSLPAAAEPAGIASGTSPGAKDVIVHLFEWPWASVASECTNVLGPKGFGGVQVSPPQEHVVLPGNGYPWWQDYQPVSYRLVSRRGDRAAFANMVSTCHTAGVKIFVDAVLNHMAGGASRGPGSDGSSYTQYAYPSVPYGFDDFHHCGRNGNDDIRSWTDRWEVQNCELVDLSDLKTESSYVRGKLSAYLQDLVSLGVDGIRVDAAKHVPVADLQAIYGPMSGKYIFQEVIEGGPGEIAPGEYTGIGDVTEFRYGDVVGNAFRDGNLANLNNLAGSMALGSADAVAFIDNHDTQRNGRARLTYKDGNNYALAEAFMLAWPYGVPQVMSSFAFNGGDQGPPAAGNGTTSPVNCAGGWVCEHRWRTTANLVGLRNASSGAGVSNWWSNGSTQIAFGRTGRSYVAFNRDGGTLSRTFQTDLPAGTYCDVAGADFSAGTCGGATYAVDSAGRFSASVPAGRVLALHVNARTSGGGGGCTTVAVGFNVDAQTVWGENVYVVGNRPELGDWNPANGVPLSAATYPIWRGTVSLPANVTFEYKYVKRMGSQVIWETGGNRVRSTGSACAVGFDDVWRN
ncbi:carbohydrate-binding module family 20 domain-containing protein [Actinophytocola sp.]|uniref:carbohydrate-binding module family 20 domain-containing protein n=1 Tax=Actinophytocola sp. TaxID=1872138 RepID=UPI002D8107B1|nr:carbohydrate-binding module family 20 domain-containing protein [Actinophytocola sp.]HET9138056.1 carbohydrate-binding module family 20 domain-containing protein [Actinophytocola sp.]